MEDAFELWLLSVVLDSSVEWLVVDDLSYGEGELERPTATSVLSTAVLFRLMGLLETSWKDSSSSLWEGVLAGCGEPSLIVLSSSCTSTITERFGDGGRGL